MIDDMMEIAAKDQINMVVFNSRIHHINVEVFFLKKGVFQNGIHPHFFKN